LQKIRTAAVELDALTGLPLGDATDLFLGTPAGAFLVGSAQTEGFKTLRILSKDGEVSFDTTRLCDAHMFTD
jgi:hypothetical protein